MIPIQNNVCRSQLPTKMVAKAGLSLTSQGPFRTYVLRRTALSQVSNYRLLGASDLGEVPGY